MAKEAKGALSAALAAEAVGLATAGAGAAAADAAAKSAVLEGSSPTQCIAALKVLKRAAGGVEAAAGPLKVRCAAAFPHCEAFGGAKAVAAAAARK
jgi:hypothetical protein